MKKSILLTTAALSIAATSAQAAAPMTDATFGTPVNNQSELLTFQQNSGGTTFNIVSIGTTTSNIGGPGWNGGTLNNTGEPADAATAMSDIYVTTNAFGTGDDADFTFGTTVNDGDGQIFYLVEHIGNDTTFIEALDAGGSVIPGWSFTIVPADYAAITTTLIYDWENQGNALGGTTFSLADFTGGAGTLTGVGGLRIDGGGALDLAQVGVAAAIPEASAALLIGGLGMLTLLRRRIK